MGQYLTRDELSTLLNVAPQSYSAMCRRLREMGWPFQPRIGACPLVLRSVHDKILTGQRKSVPA